MKPFEIVAHRGIAVDYPENTIPEFNIPGICTDQFDQAADFRNQKFS